MAYDPLEEQKAPLKAGHAAAKKNAKTDKKLNDASADSVGEGVEAAKKLAKKNAKIDDSRRGEAKMESQDVGTAERDIPEGAPVTTEPPANKTNEKKASSKDADVKKDMPDEEKRQGTDKDSASTESTDGKPVDQDANKTADKK